jgi:iron(III) transport system ATP-binding protein
VSVDAVAVEKRFGAVEAVRAANLHAPAGLLTAILGPSGCGKTTLLRLIAGFERPDRGAISIAGTTVADPSGNVFVPTERRRVGMVFQQLALFPHLDVSGNIAYGLRGASRAERSARVRELLDLVDLAGMERRYPDQLSGGQAQRIALARALAPRPQVVLLDEPFSSLDVSLRAGVRTEVRDILKREGVTAILVTHDQDEALALGDRVAVMLEGRVAQLGTPEEVYRRPASPEVGAFLGDTNLLEGKVSRGLITTEVGEAPVTASADGDAYALVRAEDLDLVVDGDARVVGAEYFGHDQLVTVVLPSGTTLRARLHARRRLDPGTAVSVRLTATDVVAFPRR